MKAPKDTRGPSPRSVHIRWGRVVFAADPLEDIRRGLSGTASLRVDREPEEHAMLIGIVCKLGVQGKG